MPAKKTAKSQNPKAEPKTGAKKPGGLGASLTTTTKTAKTKSTNPRAKPKTGVTSSAKPISSIAKAKPVTQKTTKPKPINARVSRLERTDVFVSYSHADKKWLTEMQEHLTPLGREHGINIWDDTQIQSGNKWRNEIRKALAKSKVAILLVSARFMSSAFITTDELPPLLEAAEKEGLIILSVIVGRNGAFTNHTISEYQTVNDPTSPLNLLTEGQIDEVFTQLYSRILQIFVGPPSKAPSRIAIKSDHSVPKKGIKAKQPEMQVSPTAAKRLPAKKNNNSTGSSDALLVKRNGDWMVVPVAQGNVGSEVSLELRLTTSAQRAFIMSLRSGDNLSSIVYRLQTHICKAQDVQMKTIGAKETWHLTIITQPVNRRTDVTYGFVKPEKQAELNARLLLLNEIPSNEQTAFGYYSNYTQINGGKSPLPTLYQQLNKQAPAFKQSAPLIITWFLQINSIVDHIHKLAITLKADSLTVRFEGERSSQYQNELSRIIKVGGTCDLSKQIDDKELRLR